MDSSVASENAVPQPVAPGDKFRAHPALVIDVGGSYRRLMQLFGGGYFAITLDQGADQALNPFFAPVDIMRPGGRLDERRLQFVLAVLERMVCDSRRPELGNAERAVLADAVAATYRATPARAPLLSDLVAALRAHAGDPEDVAIAHGFAPWRCSSFTRISRRRLAMAGSVWPACWVARW